MSVVLMLAALGAVAPTQTSSTVERFAVIVATNKSLDVGLADLSYADDDGARYHELLALQSKSVEVLSVLDAQTQALHPGTAAIATVPTRAGLLDSLARTFDLVRAANKRGVRTAFYFVYVGHGSVDGDGEGAMHLQDGRFSRGDLFQEVIARSPASVNHIVIDACNAFLLVAKRGSSQDAAINRAIDNFLDREDLRRYPNTGVLLSTSNASDVHEWGRFQAGIFSHEVRSALAGGGDIDGNGQVTYEEVRAFLAAANGRVRDPRAKLSPYIEAPAVRIAEPIFDRASTAGAPTVHVPQSIADKYYLQDQRGVRFADFNMSADGPVTMTLVPQPVYFLRSETSERTIPLDAVAAVDAATLEGHEVDLGARGAEEMTFRRDLFGIPYGRAFFEGFRANPPEPTVGLVEMDRGVLFTPGRIAAIGMVGGAVAAGAVGAFFGVRASSRAEEARAFAGSLDDQAALNQRSQNDARAANVLFVSGGALLVGAVVTYLFVE